LQRRTTVVLSLSKADHGRSRLTSNVEGGLVWLLGHASTLAPFLVFGLVLALSWSSLREIRIREFRLAFRTLDPLWLTAAALLTAANVAVMGLYDVIAFSHTRSRWSERWRFGAVAFAWSNFLTLGPLAGPAIRFWLYRPTVDDSADLHAGVIAISTAFTAGLVGWTLVTLFAARVGLPFPAVCVAAFVLVFLIVWCVGILAPRIPRWSLHRFSPLRVWQLSAVGWVDWFLASMTFASCMRATAIPHWMPQLARAFFLGQAIGLASFIPGGFGSSDVFWMAHLGVGGFERSTVAAALTAYRLVYYVAPWAVASMLLLAWVTSRAPRRLELARRIVAGLVGGAGVLVMLSAATPALMPRLAMLERSIPLPLVEMGSFVSALAGLLLLVLARGLARGYRAAFRTTLTLLTLASLGVIFKGFDWEEAVVMGLVSIAALSQMALFDRSSEGDWLEAADLVLACGALVIFVTLGTLSHRISADTLTRWSHIGYRLEAARFMRTAASMALAVLAGALYLMMRPPVTFTRPSDDEIGRVLDLHAKLGGNTNPLMVATGDKSVFFDGSRGIALYRTIGPYLVVFSDPVVRSTERRAFLDALFKLAGELDRRPVFYQISLDWIPVLHDRGYDFFKLGEEAQIHLERVTLEGHAGKLNRQFLRRAERDGVRFRIVEPAELQPLLPELADVSADWLRSKHVVERQFSIGFFDEAYMLRYRCALVEEASPPHRIIAFANLLEGPDKDELSVDLMRYRHDAPSVMDFLLVSLFLEGKALGYRRFNLGMAPLASVGQQRGAHARERLAHLLFQRGEQWYNFQGLRQYKDKFDPEWVPRYMAYQDTWEWPVAIAHVSALIAGSWSSVLMPARVEK
jgi:phosphatidylglycerol lysyltransferase